MREYLPSLFGQSFIIRFVIAPPSLLLLNVLDLRKFSAMKLAAGMIDGIDVVVVVDDDDNNDDDGDDEDNNTNVLLFLHHFNEVQSK